MGIKGIWKFRIFNNFWVMGIANFCHFCVEAVIIISLVLPILFLASSKSAICFLASSSWKLLVYNTEELNYHYIINHSHKLTLLRSDIFFIEYFRIRKLSN